MSRFNSIREINVGLNFGQGDIPVGRLASRDHQIYFEYDRAFIERGLEISPVRLPLKTGLIRFDPTPFEGLGGVFNDSLPDGWGRLLFDRFVRSQGMVPMEVSPLDRLAHVGRHGMGALVYEPDHSPTLGQNEISLDQLAGQAQEVLDGASDQVLAQLMALNGSSAGARPKALIGVSEARDRIIHGVATVPEGFTQWIVKFPNNQDGLDSGAIEYVYARMAQDAGISMPQSHLFPAQNGPGYFAVQRFDRCGIRRLHMHTACGLLHSDFRTPSLDYEDLIALTGSLTRDMREVEKLYRLAVFNVLAHNRDDHAKNFSFLMDEVGQWTLSPAYDLTFSSGPSGEQSTMVLGEGRTPSVQHLRKLGEAAKIPKPRIQEILDQTQSSLTKWPEWATPYGVSASNIRLIGERLNGSMS